MDLHDKGNPSNNLQCSNCTLTLTGGYIDSYALPLTGKTITVYEALQAIFKGYENISTLSLITTSDEIKFCNSCGNVFGKLLGLYTHFLELSTLDSMIHNIINEFPQQFISESKLSPQLPPVNSLQHNPRRLNSDEGFYFQHEDVKIQVDDFPEKNGVNNQQRRSGRIKKRIPISDVSSFLGSESSESDDDFAHSNIPSDQEDQVNSDLDFNGSDSVRNEINAPDTILGNPLKCEICNEGFQQRWRLKMHKEAEHEGIRKFRCRFCDFCYNNLSSLQRHEYKKHQVIRGKPRSDHKIIMTEEDKSLLIYKEYKCDAEGCETVSFSSFKEWILHQQEIHKIDTKYKDIEKQETLRPKDKFIRPCPTCGKKVKSNAEIIMHTKAIHLNLRPFECNICMKKFVTQNQLDFHTDTVHDNPKYLCNLCGTILKTKGGLMLHEQTHYGKVKPFKFECEICYKKIRKQSELKHHMQMVHSDAEHYPYPCDQCEKKFKTEKHVKIHKIRQHILTITLPESCEFCEKRFSVKRKLKEHLMSIHKLSLESANTSAKIKTRLFRILPNGDRVYKKKPIKSKTCDICGRTYARLEFLYTHLVQIHGKTEEEAKDITKLETTRTLIKPPTTTASSSNRKRKASENYLENIVNEYN